MKSTALPIKPVSSLPLHQCFLQRTIKLIKLMKNYSRYQKLKEQMTKTKDSHLIKTPITVGF